MTTLFAFLEGIPAGPLMLFGLGWLAFVVTVLAFLRARRLEESCDRCGSVWQRTPRGADWHFCVAPKREFP